MAYVQGSKYGIVTTFKHTWAIRRVDMDSLVFEVTDGYLHTCTNPSVPEVMYYIGNMAKSERQLPDTEVDVTQPRVARPVSRPIGTAARTVQQGADSASAVPSILQSASSSMAATEAELKALSERLCKGLELIGPTITNGCNMCRGRLNGKDVVVRWADAAMETGEYERLEDEMEAYEDVLSPFQGVSIPKLVYEGWSVDDCNFVVVTEHVEGSHPDRDSSDAALHRAVEALKSLHNARIAHGNLHSTNIILQKDRVFFTDFRHCISLPSPDECERDLEMLYTAFGRTYTP